MTREELIQSKEYWISKLQIDLFNEVEAYMKRNGLNRVQFAQKLGVSKGYISQILNGEADHRISKFVELALSIGLVPSVSFDKIEDVVSRDKTGNIDISVVDIERSKGILSQSGYLYSRTPVTQSRRSIDSNDENIIWRKMTSETQTETTLVAS